MPRSKVEPSAAMRCDLRWCTSAPSFPSAVVPRPGSAERATAADGKLATSDLVRLDGAGEVFPESEVPCWWSVAAE
ncbi:hypothetical protein DPM19_08145 [Actinomadura craniellae]|uniref:Uncharacterized protein n=1 Tax=Actinomadura craniellae TaxID=2231787 RepID=A0A365H9C1_9ACTN|nr:hypothetical protein DPM19_08145 [Actinomadura craniellae]